MHGRERSEPLPRSCTPVADIWLRAAALVWTGRRRDRCRVGRAGWAPQQAELGHVLGTEGRWQPSSAGVSRTLHRW